jgi:hypothetical protein
MPKEEVPTTICNKSNASILFLCTSYWSNECNASILQGVCFWIRFWSPPYYWFWWTFWFW